MKACGPVSSFGVPSILLGACLLAVPRASAEPDWLVRAYLGISSIQGRFPPPEGKKWCWLAVGKFEGGKFLGYVELPAPLDHFPADKEYEVELGWARKDGKTGYFMAMRTASVAFQADDFFEPLSVTARLTHGKRPQAMLGPFYVLGYAHDGKGNYKDSKLDPLDVRRHVQGGSRVMVFLMCPFETAEQAKKFGESLPKLSGE